MVNVELIFLRKLLLHHKQNDSEKKTPLSRRFAINVKNVGPTFFKITQMQSVSIYNNNNNNNNHNHNHNHNNSLLNSFAVRY